MEYLTVSQLMIDSGLLILIWLVQLIIYPSFRYTKEEYFIIWHARYSGLIALIVTPLMLLQVGIEIMHVFLLTPRWLRIGIIAAIWISTLSLSVPIHKRLHTEGKKSELVERLIETNWIRTVLWSILFLETTSRAFGLLAS
ncbi:MAG: hypothetical protein ACWGOX_14705 [Desulforhopalus sp.]